jgi:uncharacterized protein YecE (DUF72 family)
VFAAKMPQVVTHDKVLVDCDYHLREQAAISSNTSPNLTVTVLEQWVMS